LTRVQTSASRGARRKKCEREEEPERTAGSLEVSFWGNRREPRDTSPPFASFCKNDQKRKKGKSTTAERRQELTIFANGQAEADRIENSKIGRFCPYSGKAHKKRGELGRLLVRSQGFVLRFVWWSISRARFRRFRNLLIPLPFGDVERCFLFLSSAFLLVLSFFSAFSICRSRKCESYVVRLAWAGKERKSRKERTERATKPKEGKAATLLSARDNPYSGRNQHLPP
jgi:hypothetical protein